MGSSHSSQQSQLQLYAVLPQTLNRTRGLRQIKGSPKVAQPLVAGEDRNVLVQ